MTIFKQKKFYFIIILIAAGGYFGYTKYLQSKAPPVYDTVKVERGTLVQSVDATGQIQSAQDLSLKFEIPGILNEVKVKEGDKVKIGQILATLRLSELNAAVAQSQANLNKQLAGSTPEYIAQLQSALDKAKTDLNQAKGNGDGVESSKLVQNTYDNLSATLQSVQVVLASSITAADNILGIDNTLANDVYENYLSGRDPSILTFAKQKYLEVKKAKDGFDIATNALSVNADHKITDEAAQKGVSALVAMKDCLFFVSAVLDNTTPVGVLPQDTLTSMKSSIQTTRTTLATKYAALLTDIHSIDTARNNYYSLQTLVDRAQAALQDAKNPPRAVDVASYRAALDQAIANRDKAIIKAPIDGVITRVNSKVGETVSGADVVIKLLSPHYEISVDISETDIAKLELNDAVVMTLDAFGEDVKFTGKVFNIDPGSTVIQDVVYYKVKISIDDTDKAIKPGMTANVIIKTDSRENALFLPSRAVRTNGEKTVRVLEN
ncbi:MAG: hypothetical protein ACD_72C00314G0001, partial [uncultured bacterium]